MKDTQGKTPKTLGLGDRVRGLSSPKNLISLLITVILVVGELNYGVVGGFEKLALTLGTCIVVEVVLGLFLVGRIPPLQSAYISGISLTLLLRPAGGLMWPFVVGAVLAIGSKYVLRYRNRHLWNPSNLGIAALVLLAPNRVAILSHELGNDIAVNAVIWVLGLLIASRAKVLHISLVYALSFTGLAAVRSVLVGSPLWAEVAPLTGPMYQLLVFFMLTDPRTTVGTKRGRMAVVFIIALVEFGIRVGNDLEVPGLAMFAPAPAILSLAMVGPVALFLDLRARALQAAAQPAVAKEAAGDRREPVAPVPGRAPAPQAGAPESA